MTDLDRFDRDLLNLVQEDSGQTAESLAAQVALSPSAIQRRLRRMREEGVIAREVAVVDAAKVGRPTFFIASLQLEQERPEHLNQLGVHVVLKPFDIDELLDVLRDVLSARALLHQAAEDTPGER